MLIQGLCGPLKMSYFGIFDPEIGFPRLIKVLDVSSCQGFQIEVKKILITNIII